MTANQKPLNYEKNNYVAIVTIPGFTPDSIGVNSFIYDFAELCAEIEADEEIRVIIIADPEEKNSCKENASGNPLFPNPNSETSLPLPCLSESIAGLDRPILGVIHGDALGQGLELAMACDIRIASELSCFGLPHIHQGLIPQDGGTQRLPRLIGKGKALEMVLTGEPVDAKEALRIGLVNMVESIGNVMKKAQELAQDMAKKAPISLRFTREAIYKGMDLTLDQGLRMEGDLYLLLYGTEDRVHGIESFTKKKEPSFKGK